MRRNGITGLTASVEQDDLSGAWAVYLHDGRRSLNMTDDYFATRAAAQREAKKMLAQARAGVPLDALAQAFYEAHHKAARRASHPLANRRRRNPSSFIGERIRDAIRFMREEAHDLRKKADDIEDAWGQHDYAYLRDVGVITQSQYADIMAEAAPHTNPRRRRTVARRRR